MIMATSIGELSLGHTQPSHLSLHNKKVVWKPESGFQTTSIIQNFQPTLFYRFQQLPVYPAKTAVAHHQNMVACFGIFHDFGNKGIEVFADMQLAA